MRRTVQYLGTDPWVQQIYFTAVEKLLQYSRTHQQGCSEVYRSHKDQGDFTRGTLNFVEVVGMKWLLLPGRQGALEGRNGWSQLGLLLLSWAAPCYNSVVLDHFSLSFLELWEQVLTLWLLWQWNHLALPPQSQGDAGTGSLGCFAPQPQSVSSSGAEVCAIHCWDSQEAASCSLHFLCVYTLSGQNRACLGRSPLILRQLTMKGELPTASWWADNKCLDMAVVCETHIWNSWWRSIGIVFFIF